MFPEVPGASHMRGIRARRETGEKATGLGAKDRAVVEPNLCRLPAGQEVGVDNG